MNPQNPGSSRHEQRDEGRTEEAPGQLPEPELEPRAGGASAADEEAPEHTEDAPGLAPDTTAVQTATVEAITTLFSELGGIAKFAVRSSESGVAASAEPDATDSHNNQITINIAVLIGNNQWAGNVDGGIGGTINSPHGL